MAKYTTELLTIVQQFSTDGATWDARFAEAATKIFDFPYPIWDNAYKQTLETKILQTYMNYEICAETYMRWKLMLMAKMRRIMPKYVEIYKTTLVQFDPDNEIDLTTILKRDIASKLEETGSGKTTDTGESVSNDYPQGSVTVSDAAYYASEGQKASNVNEGQSNRHSQTEGDENSTQTRRGRMGARTQGDIIQSFRNTIIDIDVDILRDLKPLFFLLK